MVGEEIHHQQITMAVMVVVAVAVLLPSILTIVVCVAFNTSLFSYTKLCCNDFMWLHHAVLVTGLPPSASWQDLKVSMHLFNYVCIQCKFLNIQQTGLLNV